jgi:tetratricopeptide (TPR) repeat protein
MPLPARPWIGRRPHAIGILAAAALIALASYATTTVRPSAAPLPGREVGSAGVQQVGIPGDAGGQPAIGSVQQIDHSISAWTANLAANPKDFLSATNLSVLYHARGRLTADLADQQRALDAATAALSIEPKHAPARELIAVIQFTLHDFAGALASAQALYADDPSQLGALATIADAELEMGRGSDARGTYDRLKNLSSGPGVEIRLARLAYVTGDLAGAVAHARSARDAATSSDTDTGFYEYALAEYARLTGDATTARAGYNAALAAGPGDLGALVGLARVDAASGDVDAAIAGLERATAIAPQPESLWLLGDLLAAKGDSKGADDQYATVRLTGTLSRLAGTVYDRQLTAFELDHAGATQDTLAAARASLADRPDFAGHDLVAWALHRLGRDDEATIESEAARATGIVDARVLFHAGAIAVGRGDRVAGEALLRQALALGPALDPADRAEAESLLPG